MPMPAKVRKHDWHTFDTERELEVRQATNRLRENRWEIRRVGREDVVVALDDDGFDQLRVSGTLPRRLR